MSKTKIVLYLLAGLLGIILLGFIAQTVGIIQYSIFAPWKENVRREVFENTKSYTHGAIQDLGDYYRQYQEATIEEDKESIANIVRMQFPNFDAEKIDNYKLKNWFISIRGF